MRITLEEHEIEAALDAYVRTQIAVQNGQHITARLAQDTTTGKFEAAVHLGPVNTAKTQTTTLRGDGGSESPMAEIAKDIAAGTFPAKRGRGSRAAAPTVVAEDTSAAMAHQGTISGVTDVPETPVEAATDVPDDGTPEPAPETEPEPKTASAPMPAPARSTIFSGLRAVNNDAPDDEAAATGSNEEADAEAPNPATGPVTGPAASIEAPKPKSLFSFGPKKAEAGSQAG